MRNDWLDINPLYVLPVAEEDDPTIMPDPSDPDEYDEDELDYNYDFDEEDDDDFYDEDDDVPDEVLFTDLNTPSYLDQV